MCVCVLKWKQAEYIHLFIPNKILKTKPKKEKSNDEKIFVFCMSSNFIVWTTSLKVSRWNGCFFINIFPSFRFARKIF
jgi:hypothetical protein